MITTYFLIAAFALGWFSGSMHSAGEKLGREHWAWLVVLCICWPTIAYIYWKEWRDGK